MVESTGSYYTIIAIPDSYSYRSLNVQETLEPNRNTAFMITTCRAYPLSEVLPKLLGILYRYHPEGT